MILLSKITKSKILAYEIFTFKKCFYFILKGFFNKIFWFNFYKQNAILYRYIFLAKIYQFSKKI